MDDVTLFDPRPGKARRNAPATSKDAAEAITSVTGEQRRLVLMTITVLGGATDAEIAHSTGLSGDSVRPRRGELLAAGAIVDSGKRRKTTSGRMATVWEVVK